MPKPIAVALGDIHLDTLIWTKLSGVTGDAFVGYKAFLAVAQRLHVPAVIVGDLFDVARPVPKLVRFHRECMDACAASKTPVYFIQGNHDKQQGAGWAAATHDWPVYIGDGQPFDLNGIQATGLDYAPIDEIEPQVRRVKTPLLFMHQAVKQALGFENAWNCDLEWVPECVKLTVLGDIHKPYDMRTGSDLPACYTGPGHARDIDEIGPKSVIVINDDLTYERVPIPSRQIKKFTVKTVKDVENAFRWMELAKPEGELRPLLWVAHTAEMAAEVSRLRSKCITDGLVLFNAERLIDGLEEAATAKVLFDDEADVSPQAMLRKIVDPEKDKALFGFVAELIDENIPLLDTIAKRKEAC